MAIHRENVYRVTYSTNIPISPKERDTYCSSEEAETNSQNENSEKTSHNKLPDIAYGCNMLGMMGKCALRQSLGKDHEGKPTLNLNCRHEILTHTKAEAETLEHKCRTIHTLIRDNHAKYAKYTQNNGED